MFETRVQYDILKIVRMKSGATNMTHVMIRWQPTRIKFFIEGMSDALSKAPEVECFTLEAIEVDE